MVVDLQLTGAILFRKQYEKIKKTPQNYAEKLVDALSKSFKKRSIDEQMVPYRVFQKKWTDFVFLLQEYFST